MAIFVDVFTGDTGIRLAEKFFESTDVNVRNVFNGIVGALGKLAQSEAMTRAGERDPGLSIGEDLAQSVAAYSDIKKTPGMTAGNYLNQSQMFERRLDKFQEKLLSELDARSRSGKKIAAMLKAYADIVINSPAPSQGALIPREKLTKDQALELAVKRSEEPVPAAMFDSRKPKLVERKDGKEIKHYVSASKVYPGSIRVKTLKTGAQIYLGCPKSESWDAGSSSCSRQVVIKTVSPFSLNDREVDPDIREAIEHPVAV
jgi:hypothetical protein